MLHQSRACCAALRLLVGRPRGLSYQLLATRSRSVSTGTEPPKLKYLALDTQNLNHMAPHKSKPTPQTWRAMINSILRHAPDPDLEPRIPNYKNHPGSHITIITPDP